MLPDSVTRSLHSTGVMPGRRFGSGSFPEPNKAPSVEVNRNGNWYRQVVQ